MSEFATHIGSKEAEMEINGCACTFNSPPAKKDGEAPNLPPYAPRKAYMVDEYPGCPTNWMHGSSKVKSYFVPIQAEHGMWLDLNKCFQHTHHVAALISVQGVNPLTGDPLIDTAMRLEQYKHKCPRHDKEFGADLYCEECGYKWVPQNYLATTGTPSGMLWLDGFRADDGAVRQYYFTEEECKGVAAQVIGDKRVFAIGIAFYESKERKPPAPVYRYGGAAVMPMFAAGPTKKSLGGGWGPAVMPSLSVSNTKGDGGKPILRSKRTRSHGSGQSAGGFEASVSSVTPESVPMNDSYDGDTTTDFSPAADEDYFVPVKQLEIGAGAKINQRVYRDPETLDFWQDAPVGMLYINYVDEGSAKRIISIGKKDMTKKGEGFLAGLTVGKQ